MSVWLVGVGPGKQTQRIEKTDPMNPLVFVKIRSKLTKMIKIDLFYKIRTGRFHLFLEKLDEFSNH
jgi:hypothetical protein